MKEPVAAHLEWWDSSSVRGTFKVLVAVEASKDERAADGVFTEQVLADPWQLLGESSPYFRLVVDDDATFAVVRRQTAATGWFCLNEYAPGAQS